MSYFLLKNYSNNPDISRYMGYKKKARYTEGSDIMTCARKAFTNEKILNPKLSYEVIDYNTCSKNIQVQHKRYGKRLKNKKPYIYSIHFFLTFDIF